MSYGERPYWGMSNQDVSDDVKVGNKCNVCLAKCSWNQLGHYRPDVAVVQDVVVGAEDLCFTSDAV